MSSEQDSPERITFGMPNSENLQNSEMTPGSASEDEGWLGAIGSDFKNIATCFRNNIPPVIGGVAKLVHKTAMSVAAEIAELEREGFGEEDGGSPDEDPNSILLPWEMKTSHDEDNLSVFVTDEELMEDILALSRHEKTFLEPFNSCEAGDHIASDKPDFVLDESRISLIRRLLDIDESLAVMHARMSGEFSGFASLF
jgi:hypothetical protein